MSMDAIGNATGVNQRPDERAGYDRAGPDRVGMGWLEYAVPPAMLVVAIAMAVASHLHLGLTQEFAAVVGLALFCVMMLCHVLLRTADAADRADEEAAERLTAQVPSPMPPLPPAPAMPAPATSPAAVAALANDLKPRSSEPANQPLPRELEVAGASVTPQPDASAAPVSLPDVSPPPQEPASPAAWRFRPVDLQLPVMVEPDEQAAVEKLPPLGDIRPRPTITETRPSIPADRIDAILKRLAVQIRTGMPQSTGPAEPGTASPQAGRVFEGAPTDLATAAAAPGAAVPGPEAESETALTSAVDALRSTVEAMRAGAPTAASAVPPPLETARPTPTDPEIRLAAVAEALAAERANVFLEPILALAEDQARHFEVSVRLIAADGGDLDARTIAAGPGGAGLLAVFDALGLRHAAGFALKLERRGRDGTVFSSVGGRSLGDDRFVSDAAGRHAQGIADRLVLTFAQDELRGLGPAQLAALGDLGRLGFRFAITGVADLDMDFEALQALGFQFVKLDARVFLNGLEAAGQEVPASDICRFFDELGLAVVVSGIDDATLRARIEGCGVAFGQGLLFGTPRPIPVGTTASAGIAA